MNVPRALRRVAWEGTVGIEDAKARSRREKPTPRRSFYYGCGSVAAQDVSQRTSSDIF